ncbi:transcription elongation factor GreA [Mesorhizobium sp. RMAD-H1]|uniref:transcription elongation factor GreA n=1 Tax=Mesorhizobium sp. RMAD-H1 TaxID=2587065 RepID=UPI0016191129|nr:transcription elongation factor GreA [Mesorhizobium sp. RMAD-H1]MBB2970101.1 transcription elongation GreA/GreB family factor [Mesorhizobium sp. RMAD-H1]
MSRAFTKEQDDAPIDIAERPISPHRNLVTPEGLKQIESEIATLQEQLHKASDEEDRETNARVARDLRYWTARRETAEVSVPDPDSDVVRFGMTVTIENDDGKAQTWKIVGEDEADAAHGKISHVSPVAVALFGKGVGDVITVNDKEWEITAIG